MFKRLLAGAVVAVVWVIVRGIEAFDSDTYERDDVDREEVPWLGDDDPEDE